MMSEPRGFMKQTILVFVLLLFTDGARAWGPIGHRIVGQIAEDNLTPQSKKSIKLLLGDQTLAQVSTWADMIRSDPNWAQAKPWHFVDIADSENYNTAPKDPNGDVVVAIGNYVKALKNPKSSNEEKLIALKFLVHFVGDIHQPLHVGRPEDRGGNMIKVKFFDRSLNFHSLWDSGMIDYQQISFLEYARSLQNQKSEKVEDFDLDEITLSTVMNENLKIRNKIYEFNTINSEVIELGKDYFNSNLETMNQRLLLGGKRLAVLLNKIFNP